MAGVQPVIPDLKPHCQIRQVILWWWMVNWSRAKGRGRPLVYIDLGRASAGKRDTTKGS